MKLNKDEYKKLTEVKSPPSPIVKNVTWAFVSGGLICAMGQAVVHYAGNFSLEEKEKSGLAAVVIILLTAIATGLKFFDNIAKHAGAGTFVPITGFANSIVSPAMEFKNEGLILGMGAKMFVVAGPVLVYGISASVIYGLILYIFKIQ